ncbi:MAG TPA: PIN domain-containing protein [Chloroflexota bacterium]|nr:PIN domain-containing protein [Chloroflexota bacterium]
MSSFVVVVDTCSLFPLTLRDVLLRAAEEGLYRPRWSEDILEELRRNLIADRGLSAEQARHLLSEMRRAFPEATVTGYERLIGSMTNAPKDRHVLAIAVHCGAQVIVTDNLKDFPIGALEPYNIETQSPDEFLEDLFDLYPDQLVQVIVQVNASRKKNPETLAATLDRLNKSTPGFVTQLRQSPVVAQLLQREQSERSE